MFKDWIQLFKKLPDNNYSTIEFICPECGEKAIDYLYVGDENIGIGYLPIWCNKCKQGIQLSRVGIPEGAKKISINDTDSIRENIPNFSQVYPPD